MKRQCYIRIEGDIINAEYIGYLTSMDIDCLNNIGIFELSQLVCVQMKDKETKDDRIPDK